MGALQSITLPPAPAGASRALNSLYVRGPNDVWVLAAVATGRTLLHWDGATWAESPLQFTAVRTLGALRGLVVEPDNSVMFLSFSTAGMLPGIADVYRCVAGSCSVAAMRAHGASSTSVTYRPTLVRDASGAVWVVADELLRRAPGQSDFVVVPGFGPATMLTVRGSGVLALRATTGTASPSSIVYLDGATGAQRTVAEGPPLLSGAGFWLESERSLWWGTPRGGLLRWTAP
jgi:hypothetical protein